MMVMNDPSWWEQRGTHQAGIAGFCEILNFPAWHEHAHVQLSLQPVSELYFCLMIKCICVLCARWCSILWPHALCNPLGSSARGIFQACLLEGVAISYSKDLPQPGTELTDLTSPALAGGFFTMVPPGHILKKRAIFFFLKIFLSLHWICYNTASVLCFLTTRYVGSHLLEQRANPYPLCTRRQSLNHWTVREVPGQFCSDKGRNSGVKGSGYISPEVTLWLSPALGNQWPGLPSFLRFL